jgi:hypothetical protein
MNARLAVLSALLLVATSCRTPPPPPAPTASLDRLAAWMTGSFSSAAQAKEDPDFLDIRLHMARIWPDRADGVWLYVEQAVATAMERPYRQRVYSVTYVGGDLYESRVFELPDPAAAVGAWKEDAPLAALTPEMLVVREGASIYLRDLGNRFEGSTLGRMCKSDFRGAAYATSEVTVYADRLVSWDRGFDADGKQVWGAVKGGYVFVGGR